MRLDLIKLWKDSAEIVVIMCSILEKSVIFSCLSVDEVFHVLRVLSTLS